VLAVALLTLAMGFQAHSVAKPADTTYAALSLYEGTWQVSRANRPSGSKPDVLSNRCALVGKYFVCEQAVNGNAGALLVFISTGQPGKFYTQTIMPEGRATGRDDLEIAGDRWIYSSKRLNQGTTTYYRTTNVFQGKNKIHFEQAESADGKEWSIKNSGDEVRIGGSAGKAR
jgi:hypothetical protein